ncbi:uncharacterized protein LOC107220108 isoform X1 [Neodiprion lecontei]|uniref:XK-related protein n=2 Tax=Neodiprion lecontei TaxID=441921 RepID=A0ABM3G269_NEOLC|nr:uncharacterized protein LOC107220108 isoform X1 [Neodiprion lecontei]
MAAAELKPVVALCNQIPKPEETTVDPQSKLDNYNFEVLDVILWVFPVVTFLVNVITDGLVVNNYLSSGYLGWAYFTVIFMLLPAIIVQLFSLRWHHSDGSLKYTHWMSHIIFMGVIHRYLVLLHAAIESLKNGQSKSRKDWVLRQQSDICMLHLFESFMESAPQILLQLYVMVVLQEALFWTTISAAASLCSLAWAIAAYTRAMRRARPDKCENAWPSLTLQAFWRGGMLTSRIAALVLAAVCIKEWIFLLLGIHWLGMTTWVILQNTDFCSTKWEERIYNCVIGVIYCFDFFNLCEGQSRYRVLCFYLVTIAQNIVFLSIYIIYVKSSLKFAVLTISMVMIIGGTVIGLISMLLYYGKFHPAGPIKLCDSSNNDAETASQKTVDKSGTLRSLKHRWHASVLSIPHSVDLSQVTTVSDDITADKKSLLTNIVQSSEFVEEGIVNQSCDVSDVTETVVKVVVENSNINEVTCSSSQNYISTVHNLSNSPNSQNMTNEILHSQIPGNYQNFSRSNLPHSINVDSDVEDDYVECNNIETLRRQKRRGICSPVELGLETDDSKSDDLNSSLQSQKRRGICSSAQLGLELVTDEDNYVEKNFKFEKRRPMIATESEIGFDLNSFAENSSPLSPTSTELLALQDSIKDRERLDTPVISETDKISESDKISEEISQKEETMSHVTSVHDYENVCPLGIARPPWCIRSWKGYTDIETYIHDDSVVRDRRRDTLTSSATGTTFSSEFSDPTCTSPAPRKGLKRSRQDDYLDTLVYDLEDWESNVTSNEEISTSTLSDIDEEEANLFVAKPIVIDDKGGMFALDTILEEREDSVSSSDTGIDLRRANNCSVSTLVATIDEIRKCTAENSPRHVYHRTESQWEDLDPKMLIKKVQLAKVLFSNDFNKFSPCKDVPHSSLLDSSLIFNSAKEIEAMKEMTKCYSTASIRRTPLINAILSDSPILGPKAKIQKYNSIADDLNISNLEEHNVYVEMRPLIPEKSDEVRKMIPTMTPSNINPSNPRPKTEIVENMTLESEGAHENFIAEEAAVIQSSENYQAPLVTFSRAPIPPSETFSNGELPKVPPIEPKAVPPVLNANFSYPVGVHASYEKRRRNVNRPRRKFSLLRERFEPKSERLIYTVTPQSRNSNLLTEPRTMLYLDQTKFSACDKQMSIILNDKFNAEDFTASYDKENLTPAVTSRISHWNSFINEHNSSISDKLEMKDNNFGSLSNLKEKRSIFLKQVLSPPKFQNWGKKRTFSPNAKMLPKAL